MGRTPHPDHYGGVAQLEERPTLTRQVLGSNPSSSANNGTVPRMVIGRFAKPSIGVRFPAVPPRSDGSNGQAPIF